MRRENSQKDPAETTAESVNDSLRNLVKISPPSSSPMIGGLIERQKRPRLARAVKSLSLMFFVPFIPVALLAIWTMGSVGSVVLLAFGPVLVYLTFAGIVYLIILIIYALSRYASNSERAVSIIVALSLIALIVWQVVPRFFLQD